MKFKTPALMANSEMAAKITDWRQAEWDLGEETSQWFLDEVERCTGSRPTSVTFEAWASESDSAFGLEEVAGHPMEVGEILRAITACDDEDVATDVFYDMQYDNSCLGFLVLFAQRHSSPSGLFQIP